MASFIGSNLQTFHYNFKHKIAGSTVENPLKIYSGSVNPSNPFVPTSNEWKEIKNQAFIDRLYNQDGSTVVETTSNSVLGNIVSTNAPVDGMMNVEIGGNTLKNEIQNGDFSNGTEGWNNNGGVTSSASDFELTCTLSNTSPASGVWKKSDAITDRKYYVVVKIYPKYVGSGSIGIGGDYKTINLSKSNSWNTVSVILSSVTTGALTVYLDTTSDYVIGDTFKIKEVMAIDLTAMFGAGNEPTKEWCDANLSYFDGIKSVGETEGNKIEALTTGKNLIKEKITESAGVTISNLNDEFKLEWTGGFNATIESVTGTLCKVKKNTNYTITFYSRKVSALAKIRIRGGDGEYIADVIQLDSVSNIKNSLTFNTGNNEKIKIDIIRNGSEIGSTILKQFQLEEGTTATPYEPYKEDKLDILNIVLRGFNNVRDLASGDTITRKIGKRAYQTGDETNTAVLTDKVNTLYVLDSPVIEKLPQPLTLQSFKSGTLQVNTDIPPYIKEWHTTNPDDSGVIQYQSGTTGLSQAFLTQIPLTSITNDIFGGSLPALKSAYKLTSNCDISAYGSGNNNGVETNNISYKVWNGTEYVLLNTNTSNVVSNINNILNNSNYVVDNNIYILMHTLPASDTIKSQINLDYFNANIDIARQPDNVIIPDTVKNTYIPTNYTIFAKVACLKTTAKKVITQYFKDTNNYIELNIENNKINFVKCINGVITTLSSNVLDYNKYQVVGVIAQQQNTGMKLSILKNNGKCEHFSNTDVNILSVATEWKLGQDINITNQLDGFILDYQFTDKTFTVTECEVMLKGRNTTGDITYDSFVKDYENGKIASGFILPNNKYKVTGQAKLYYNDVYIRTVENCEFIAKDDENKVELIGMAELVRVD